jgi:hypothetical protein
MGRGIRATCSWDAEVARTLLVWRWDRRAFDCFELAVGSLTSGEPPLPHQVVCRLVDDSFPFGYVSRGGKGAGITADQIAMLL